MYRAKVSSAQQTGALWGGGSGPSAASGSHGRWCTAVYCTFVQQRRADGGYESAGIPPEEFCSGDLYAISDSHGWDVWRSQGRAESDHVSAASQKRGSGCIMAGIKGWCDRCCGNRSLPVSLWERKAGRSAGFYSLSKRCTGSWRADAHSVLWGCDERQNYTAADGALSVYES